MKRIPFFGIKQMQFIGGPLWVLLTLVILLVVSGCGSVTLYSRVDENIHIELKPEDYEFITRVEGKAVEDKARRNFLPYN